jgi:hypothetical protein
MKVSKSDAAKIAKLAAAGKTDAEIDRAVYAGEKKWSTREISYVARRESGLIPNRVGEPVTAASVRSVLAEAPKLRAYAIAVVFGLAPTRANVASVSRYVVVKGRGGRLASGDRRAAKATA